MTEIAICLPCYSGEVSLAWMGCYVRTHELLSKEGIKIDFVSMCGNGLIPAARAELMATALESEADIFLMVDQRQLWEPVGVLRLIRDLKDHAMVCAPVATSKGSFHAKYTGETDGFLKEAYHSAIGFSGIRRDVYESVCKKYPELECQDKDGKTIYALFNPEVVEKAYIGEDLMFTKRVREAGYKVWVDEAIRVRRLC